MLPAHLQPLSKNALKKLEKAKKAAEEKAAKAAAAAAKVRVLARIAAYARLRVCFRLDDMLHSLDPASPC